MEFIFCPEVMQKQFLTQNEPASGSDATVVGDPVIIDRSREERPLIRIFHAFRYEVVYIEAHGAAVGKDEICGLSCRIKAVVQAGDLF